MRVNVTLEPDMRSPLGGIDSPFGPSGVLNWLLPQVAGNGIQYEFTRDQYWLGSWLTARANVLADTRASDALFDNAAGVYSAFGTNVPAITDRGLYVGGQIVSVTGSGEDISQSPWANFFSAESVAPVLTDQGASGALQRVRFQSLTTDSRRRQNFSATSGQVYQRRTRLKINSDCAAYIFLRMTSGITGRSVITVTAAGVATVAETSDSITMTDVQTRHIGDGVYDLTYKFTMNQTGTVLRDIGALGATIPYDITYHGDDVYLSSFLSDAWISYGTPAPTRAADAITNPNFSTHAATFGFANGMAALARVNLTRLSDQTARRIATFGTAADGAYIEFTTSNTFKAVLRKSSADAVTLESGVVGSTGVYDVTATLDPGAYALTVSGGIAGDTDASAETLPAAIANACYIGQKEDTTLHLNGPLERLAMWAS